MNISKISIQNFTVFDNFELEAKEGINVIIGHNGTGKTHLLKLIYSVCESVNYEGKDVFDISQPFFRVNSINLVRDRQDKNKKTNVTVHYADDSNASYAIIKHEGMKLAADGSSYNNIDFKIKDIFIPAKEMLSHSKGFLALNNKYDMPFDRTYVDIITNAELPETREISQLNQKLLDIISKIIDGKVVYENDTFYVIKTDGSKIEFSIEAEGLRKFGLLWKLIRNGLIDKDTVLLWDEPEANINPELIPVLVDILLEFQRAGVQVFVATHSYNFAKYFEIKRENSDVVLYHNLYKTEYGVKAQSENYFGKLKNNPIIEADSKLLDEVIEGSFGE